MHAHVFSQIFPSCKGTGADFTNVRALIGVSAFVYYQRQFLFECLCARVTLKVISFGMEICHVNVIGLFLDENFPADLAAEQVVVLLWVKLPGMLPKRVVVRVVNPALIARVRLLPCVTVHVLGESGV